MTYEEMDTDEPLARCLGRTIRAMARRMQNIFAREGFDVTSEQWILMMNLLREEGQFQQQLADNIYKDKASVTRMITVLEKRGFVARIPDNEDRRQKKVRLTEEGLEILGELLPLAALAQEEATRGIEEEDILFLKKAILKIYENVTDNSMP